jgi:hypothetical protein
VDKTVVQTGVEDDFVKVRLLDLAHAPFGRQGRYTANVGVIALRPEWYAVIARQLTRDPRPRTHHGVITGDVERFELPNLNA